jgi:hypothetical protein
MDMGRSKNKFLIPVITSLVVLISSSCGLTLPPAPQPQLSATVFPPRATALSELPPTWTPIPTSTPSPTIPPSPTPLPTQDPDNYQIGLAMTPVSADYPVDPEDRIGWIRLEGKTATMFIPPSYEVLDFTGVFIDLMFGVMEAFVEGFTELALDFGEEMGPTPQVDLDTPDLGEIPETDFLIAVEEVSQSAIILVSVDITPTTTTEDLLNQALSNSDTEFEPVTRQIYQDAPYPIERVILDVEDEELGSGKQIIYVILGDQNAWNVVFTTPTDLFEQNLPVFESAINSFSVK